MVVGIQPIVPHVTVGFPRDAAGPLDVLLVVVAEIVQPIGQLDSGAHPVVADACETVIVAVLCWAWGVLGNDESFRHGRTFLSEAGWSSPAPPGGFEG